VSRGNHKANAHFLAQPRITHLDDLAQSLAIEVDFAFEAPWTYREQQAYTPGITATTLGIDQAREVLVRVVRGSKRQRRGLREGLAPASSLGGALEPAISSHQTCGLNRWSV
jgi:hypothetical protein